MKFKNSLLWIGIIVISFVISTVHIVSIVFWDNLFLISLFFFVVSGFLYLIERGTFDLFFKSFRIFYTKSSKLQNYASRTEHKGQRFEKAKLVSPALMGVAIRYSGLFIVISITMSYLFYYE